MSFYKELGIDCYINAHDTYTIYGGSRMSPKTLAAMAEAAEHFVDIDQMQRVLGEKIALMTKNEGAYISNGAAGALTLAAAVCMVGDDPYLFSRLPNTEGIKDEIIVIRSQRNGYDKAIEVAGATLVEVGDGDETLAYELEGAINDNTAAVFYFQSMNYERTSLPLQEVIQIAHGKGVPVVVDAAAGLPPVENLWKFTEMGADLALFSGGKTLSGPQDSGLILGRADFIAACQQFGAPVHGICRGSKTSREAMAGLMVALEEYLALDQEEEYLRLERICQRLGQTMTEASLDTSIVPFGPVGQAYPRIFGKCKRPDQALEIVDKMKAQKIYIGCDKWTNQIYISPLNLRPEEVEIVEKALDKILKEGENDS